MYLSRIILNPMSRRVQRELASPYEMHRSLMRGYAHLPEGDIGRVLFRVDVHSRTGVPTVLLQSPHLPCWDWLYDTGARDYLLPQDVHNPATKPLSYQLEVGQELAFRLRANPCVRRKIEDKTKRIGLLREEEQRAWLERKATLGGFQIMRVIVTQEGKVHGWINRDGTRHKLSIISVRFDGLMQVNNPHQVWQTIKQGIGSAKAMGFGLLTIAPPTA